MRMNGFQKHKNLDNIPFEKFSMILCDLMRWNAGSASFPRLQPWQTPDVPCLCCPVSYPRPTNFCGLSRKTFWQQSSNSRGRDMPEKGKLSSCITFSNWLLVNNTWRRTWWKLFKSPASHQSNKTGMWSASGIQWKPWPIQAALGSEKDMMSLEKWSDVNSVLCLFCLATRKTCRRKNLNPRRVYVVSNSKFSPPAGRSSRIQQILVACILSVDFEKDVFTSALFLPKQGADWYKRVLCK